MKSKIKAFAAAAFAVMTIAAVSLSSLAGQWVQHGPGWKYQNDDGSFLNDGWHWIDGNGDGIAEDYY
ncbi:MAG: choline-binding protein, partial [Eubacteriales bacterium]|nr:choline-binding protein [Eubacteriales bacterium]